MTLSPLNLPVQSVVYVLKRSASDETVIIRLVSSMIDSKLDANVAGANDAVENERRDPKPALAMVVTDEDDEGEINA